MSYFCVAEEKKCKLKFLWGILILSGNGPEIFAVIKFNNCFINLFMTGSATLKDRLARVKTNDQKCWHVRLPLNSDDFSLGNMRCLSTPCLTTTDVFEMIHLHALPTFSPHCSVCVSILFKRVCYGKISRKCLSCDKPDSHVFTALVFCFYSLVPTMLPFI